MSLEGFLPAIAVIGLVLVIMMTYVLGDGPEACFVTLPVYILGPSYTAHFFGQTAGVIFGVAFFCLMVALTIWHANNDIYGANPPLRVLRPVGAIVSIIVVGACAIGLALAGYGTEGGIALVLFVVMVIGIYNEWNEITGRVPGF